jgi:hypothetical protein
MTKRKVSAESRDYRDDDERDYLVSLAYRFDNGRPVFTNVHAVA